jgi:hypothetical protein
VRGGHECDFCSTDGANRDYHNRAFGVRTSVGKLDVLEGIWRACAECAALIDAGRWEILVERAVNRHASLTDDEDGCMSEFFRTFYGALQESLKEQEGR